MPRAPLIFLIAGEASGDQLGADLMASLKAIQKIRFAGIGGEAMKAQGLQSLFPMEELSLMGFVNILSNLPTLWHRLKSAVETIRVLKPDVVVTIDAPEFSFRVMKRLHKLPQRPRLVHYVAPTVWAWRPGRARGIARFLDHLLCLYPFEPPYFEKEGLKTTFVGHPIVKEKVSKGVRDPNLLCVLPGSRRSEVETLLPIFKETAAIIKRIVPDINVVIPTVSSVEPLIRQGVQAWPVTVQVIVGDEARKEVFQKASAALAASGTVALQLSASRLPFVIAYKVGKVTGWGAHLLIKSPWACMINILLAFKKFGPNFVLNRQAKDLIPDPWIPEFIQKDCTPEKLAPALLRLLKDEAARVREVEAMEEAVSLLEAPPDAAARAVLNEIV